jgi:hypothetical protein
VAYILSLFTLELEDQTMEKRCWMGLILLTGLLTGCGAHGSTHLAAGRQFPLGTHQGGISVHLNETSELQFNLKGFRMGISPHGGSQRPSDERPDPTPWLRYRLQF